MVNDIEYLNWAIRYIDFSLSLIKSSSESTSTLSTAMSWSSSVMIDYVWSS